MIRLMKRLMRGTHTRNRSDWMTPTVSSNHARIVKVEEDLTNLEDKVEVLDRQFVDVMARLDTLLRIGRGIAVMVAASLGFDLSIEGGMI